MSPIATVEGSLDVIAEGNDYRAAARRQPPGPWRRIERPGAAPERSAAPGVDYGFVVDRVNVSVLA
jgi:hypothetical protein